MNVLPCKTISTLGHTFRTSVAIHFGFDVAKLYQSTKCLKRESRLRSKYIKNYQNFIFSSRKLVEVPLESKYLSYYSMSEYIRTR